MESSSENSFLWSDASNDTIVSEEMAKTKIQQSDVESDYGQSYKKKLHRELFANGDNEIESDDKPTEKSRKRKIKKEESDHDDCPLTKKIKVEPESDVEPTKKTKRKKSVNEDYLHDDSTYDESYLNLRVKEEQTFTAPAEKPKKKKRKSEVNTNSSENEVDTKTDVSYDESIDTNNFNHTADSEDNETKSKKKKKKSKKKRHSVEDVPFEDNTPIEEKFTAEETIVETRRSTNISESYNDNSYHENNDKRNISQNTEHSDSEYHEENIESPKLNSQPIIEYEMQTLSSKKTGRTISERIRFEDEESDVDVRKTVKEKSRKLRNYLKANVNLKPVICKLNKDTMLSSDDEIFIIKCPSNVDTAAFEGVKLNLDKKCKLKISDQTYEGYLEEEQSKIALLTLNNNKTIVKPVTVNGLLRLRKRIPKLHIPDDSFMVNNQTNFTPLPDTKCRHPLFGSNYKKAIKVPSHVAERLKESHVPEVEVEVEKVKKKKKKKDKVKSEHVEENQNEVTNDVEVPVKKSKKRKHTAETEEVRPKKAKRKHNLDSAEAWESEKAIEESLFTF